MRSEPAVVVPLAAVINETLVAALKLPVPPPTISAFSEELEKPPRPKKPSSSASYCSKVKAEYLVVLSETELANLNWL
jgi:hypothetical protein